MRTRASCRRVEGRGELGKQFSSTLIGAFEGIAIKGKSVSEC